MRYMKDVCWWKTCVDERHVFLLLETLDSWCVTWNTSRVSGVKTSTPTYQHTNSTNAPTPYIPTLPPPTYLPYLHCPYKPTKDSWCVTRNTSRVSWCVTWNTSRVFHMKRVLLGVAVCCSVLQSSWNTWLLMCYMHPMKHSVLGVYQKSSVSLLMCYIHPKPFTLNPSHCTLPYHLKKHSLLLPISQETHQESRTHFRATFQHVAIRCNTLQHRATQSNTEQHSAM